MLGASGWPTERGGDRGPATCPDSIGRLFPVETPRLSSVTSATCTCHRQVFLPHKGIASCWSRSWPALSSPLPALTQPWRTCQGSFSEDWQSWRIGYCPEGAVPMVLFRSCTRVNSSALFYWSSWAVLQHSLMAVSKTKSRRDADRSQNTIPADARCVPKQMLF